MTGFLVIVLLISAALHAGWNAAARMRPNSGETFAAFVIAAGVWAVGLLAYAGPPALASLPWMAAGIVANLIGMRALIGAYERTSFALAYPITRGLTPLTVLLLAFLVSGQWPGRLALAGICLVCFGVAALSLLARRLGRRDLAGVAFAALAAAGTGGAAVCDAIGVGLSGTALGYSASVAIANAVTLGGLFHFEGRRPLAALIAKPGYAFFWSGASMVSFVLVIWGFTQAPAAIVAAVRETSVLFATAFAALILREPLTRLHWLASGLAAAGIVLIRLE